MNESQISIITAIQNAFSQADSYLEFAKELSAVPMSREDLLFQVYRAYQTITSLRVDISAQRIKMKKSNLAQGVVYQALMSKYHKTCNALEQAEKTNGERVTLIRGFNEPKKQKAGGSTLRKKEAGAVLQ